MLRLLVFGLLFLNHYTIGYHLPSTHHQRDENDLNHINQIDSSDHELWPSIDNNWRLTSINTSPAFMDEPKENDEKTVGSSKYSPEAIKLLYYFLSKITP